MIRAGPQFIFLLRWSSRHDMARTAASPALSWVGIQHAMAFSTSHLNYIKKTNALAKNRRTPQHKQSLLCCPRRQTQTFSFARPAKLTSGFQICYDPSLGVVFRSPRGHPGSLDRSGGSILRNQFMMRSALGTFESGSTIGCGSGKGLRTHNTGKLFMLRFRRAVSVRQMASNMPNARR